MNFKIFIMVLLCLVGKTAFSQSISGTVKSQSGEGVAFANITVLNTNLGITADKGGHFSLNLSEGNYQIAVSAIGFAGQTTAAVVENGRATQIDFSLREANSQLTEVIVSADKVEAQLQKTPLAITALTAKEIENYRVWSISDLTALAPSAFTIEHGNSTASTFLNIRGALGFTNEQSVATYVDGVYQFDFFSAPFNFNNIERIEILRGPQGTLYGRNAFSGVVNIITKKPTNRTSAQVDVDMGNYRQQRYSASASLPLVKNKFFLGLGGQLNKRGAVYENTTLNDKDFDSRQSLNGFVNLRYLASEKWAFDLNLRSENNKDAGSFPWVATDSIALNDPYKAFGNFPNTEKRTNTNGAFTARFYGKKFNFTSQTAGIKFHAWYPDRFDFDFTPARFFSGDNDTEQQQITEELRFSSPTGAGRLKWTLGSFLFLEKTESVGKTYFDEDYALFDPNAPYVSITNGKRNNRGAAFFGQATYSISEKLDLTLGARYDIERRERTENSALEQGGVVVPLTADTTFQRDFSAFTPKAILSFELSENTMAFLSYAKGFRVGGFNVNSRDFPSYDPETSDNYEIGIKNDLFDRKLRLNLTAFYFQQKDQQVTTSKDGINYATLNVGDMNNFGVEAELSALPVRNLQIDWTASTSNSDYAKLPLFDIATLSLKDFKGNQAIYNPKFQSMLAAQYTVPFKSSKQKLAVFVRGEYRYTGEYQLNFENTESQEGYSIINARAGLTSKHFDVAVWGRNLNDARYLGWGTFASYMLGAPRMVGVTLSARI
ncbi:MAG: TonB-dependent receptor [Saprospiraceae bacterium]|nr:TonB-dependent receptor [Saprospiraceae bacterium]